jgi:DNA-binding MarR family transcriptional regulator
MPNRQSSPRTEGSPRREIDPSAVVQAWGRAQAAAAIAAPMLSGTDFTMTQLRFMGQLIHHGRTSGRELASALGITPSSVVTLVDRLENKGFVRRVADQADRRVTWIELTDEGRMSFQGLWLPAARKVMEVAGQFTDEEREVFERLLNRIATHLEAKVDG